MLDERLTVLVVFITYISDLYFSFMVDKICAISAGHMSLNVSFVLLKKCHLTCFALFNTRVRLVSTISLRN